MKLKLYFITIFILLTNFCISQNYTAYVFGYVKDSSGNALSNKTVIISLDSTSLNTCTYTKTKLTNANGFYSDTIYCIVGVARSVKVSTLSCNALVSNNFVIPTSKTIEANFRVCSSLIPTPIIKTCIAKLNAQTVGLNAYFSSNGSITGNLDSIVLRTWSFGNGISANNNAINTSYVYTNSGIYNACLIIKTAKGCIDTSCINVAVRDSATITPPVCNAIFTHTKNNLNIKLNSISSSSASNDSIVSRTWNFGDSTTLSGNIIDPSKTYARSGIYYVCLNIRTAKGCTKQFCMAISVVDSPPPPNNACRANFSYIPTTTVVKFNSNNSFKLTGDSIISRTWNFGDSTTTSVLSGNVIEPTKTYARQGTYKVCLTITTKLGCTNTYCGTVITTNVPSACIPQFTTERIIQTKNIRFNSNISWTATNDSIIERRWNFGDATTLLGNVVNPLKIYPVNGLYNACLRIKTTKGCINEYCRTVLVSDSLTSINPNVNNGIKIVQIFPIPAITNVAVNVYSAADNVRCEVGIYDIYGAKKWNTVVTLQKGNNIQNIPLSMLPRGPYFIRVTSTIGNDNRPFYKM